MIRKSKRGGNPIPVKARKPAKKKEPSELEETLLYQLRIAGFPVPTRQLMFAKGIGRRWLWDFSWDDIKLAVEVQGGIWMRHGAHNTGAAIIRDAEKANEAVLLGWTVLHVTELHIREGQALIWIARAMRKLGYCIPYE